MAVRVWTISVPAINPITETATLIVDANPGRTELFITNNDASIIAYVGPINQLASTYGYTILPKTTLSITRGYQIYLGPLYAVAASSSIDLRMWEAYDIDQKDYDRLGTGVDSNTYSEDTDSLILSDSFGFLLMESGEPIGI